MPGLVLCKVSDFPGLQREKNVHGEFWPSAHCLCLRSLKPDPITRLASIRGCCTLDIVVSIVVYIKAFDLSIQTPDCSLVSDTLIVRPESLQSRLLLRYIRAARNLSTEV